MPRWCNSMRPTSAATRKTAEWPSPAINHVLEGIRGKRRSTSASATTAGQTVQKGFWRELLPFLNALRADHVVLEFARRGYEGTDRCSAT